jgi:hypothetical protein
MHRRDLDKNMDSSRERSDTGGSRNRMGGGSRNDRTRNRGDIGSDMSDTDMSDSDMYESGEDLQRKQSDGNLGNERVRGVGE